MKTVFILDDDKDIRDLLVKYLSREGYSVEVFATPDQLLNGLDRQKPDIFVLDIMLPGEVDGLELCTRLRQTTDAPIIFVSAKGEEADRIVGLELGADDYLTKPFSPRELLSRMKAVFRRVDAKNISTRPLEFKGVLVIPEAREIYFEGKKVEVTAKEFDLLALLMGSVNRAFSRQQLLDAVWGYDYVGDARAVDDLVKRVRRKLREAGAPVVITTVWGYGYKISD